MTRVAVLNQKGGVGKTTTALNLGAALGKRDIAPLLIDLDPQAHLTAVLLGGVEYGSESLFAYFNGKRSLGELKRPVDSGGTLIPAHSELMKVDSIFGKGPNILNKLTEGLAEDLKGARQPVLIDCSPMLGVLSLNAVFAADLVIIPVSSDYLALKSALRVEKTLKALEPVLKRRVERRYLLTRFDQRRKMSWEILRQLQETFGAELLASRIAENVSLAESPSVNRDVFAHAPSSRGAQDHSALLDELISTGLIPEVSKEATD